MAEQATHPISPAKPRALRVVGSRRNIGYSRKSRITAKDYISDEIQQDGIARAADRRGESVDEILGDWNKSGAEGKEHLRSDYQKLLRMIENDEVNILFGYDRSRLSRGLVETARLAKLCNAHGTLIVTEKEGELDYVSANSVMLVNILASIAQNTIDQAKEKSEEGIAVRRARGDIIGQTNYGWMVDKDDKTKLVRNPDEPLERVIAVFAENRSFLRTAKQLTTEGVPPRRKQISPEWSAISVKQIIAREAKDLLPAPRHRAKGVKPQAPFVFYRMLVCHCGKVLTGQRTPTGNTTFVRYVCSDSTKRPGHPNPKSVTEKAILGWAKDTVAEYADGMVDFDVDKQAKANEIERSMLERQRRQVIDLFKKSQIEVEEKDLDIAAIDARILELDESEQALAQNRIDWDTDSPAAINELLRGLMAPIQLDANLRPTDPDWLIGRAAPVRAV